MKNNFLFLTLFLFPFLGIIPAFAQEEEKIDVEESAEVFLEEYTDEFQEVFFEALKQKGIQNYDRASNLLLKCKQMRPDDSAIDHELAKVNLLDKQYITAQRYAIEAVISEPENYWFLHTLNEILMAQGNADGVINEDLAIPFKNEVLRYNLASIQFKQRRYHAALEALKGLKKSDSVALLVKRIRDSIQKVEQAPITEVVVESTDAEDPVQQLREQLEGLAAKSDYKTLRERAQEAVEAYPLQPYFYYMHGLALNKSQEFGKAAEVLEMGLDYIFNNEDLMKKFYHELAAAYQGIGNPSKANEYLSKLKSGL